MGHSMPTHLYFILGGGSNIFINYVTVRPPGTLSFAHILHTQIRAALSLEQM